MKFSFFAVVCLCACATVDGSLGGRQRTQDSEETAWTCTNCARDWNTRYNRRKTSGDKHGNGIVDVHVNTRHALCTLDEKFLSFSIDAIEMKRKFQCFSMKSRKLNTLAKALSPAYLRIGGTPQDFATFVEKGTDSDDIHETEDSTYVNCTPHFDSWRTMKEFELPMRHFGEAAEFAKRNDLNLIFGLNALTHRKADSSWDETPSLNLIKHAHENNYSLTWELGNEPNRYRKYGKTYTVSPKQLAKDYKKLKNIVKSDAIVGPSVASRNPKGLKYLKSFLETKEFGSLEASTYHHYFMHQTVSTLQKYVNPIYLKHLEAKMQQVKLSMLWTDSAMDLWLGESGSSSGGGAKNISDTYASGFLYLGTLGLASKYCHKVVIRQSFYGGHYGMIDSITHYPLPDYWTSLLFKRLVGKTSLKVHVKNKLLNVQAYCNKHNPNDVTLVVVNFSKRWTTFALPRYRHHKAVEYLLTADNLQSKVVRLNGKQLKLGNMDRLPNLNGRKTNAPFHIPRRSYGFYVVKNVRSRICRSSL